MTLKGLRANRSERELHRRSTLDPHNLFKRAEKAASANPSADGLAPDHHESRPQNVVRSESDGLARASWSGERSPSPPIQDHTPMTRRFSTLRFRHASDSHLSQRAREHAATASEPPPPVPPIPAAPSIITTAPTMEMAPQPPPPNNAKKKSRFQQFARRRMSFDPTSLDSTPRLSGEQPARKGRVPSFEKRRTFVERTFGKSSENVEAEDPGRLSISAARNPSDAGLDGSASSQGLTVPRLSDSSRGSDGSFGEHGGNASPHKRFANSRTGSLFAFPRRQKNRGPLFPLPVKIPPPPEFPNTAPATPRASISALSSGSATHSPGEHSPPHTAVHRARASHSSNGANSSTPPPHSPVNATAPTINFPAGHPQLFRQSSTTSTRSARSSPNGKQHLRMGLRGRSSTMNSYTATRDKDRPPPTPPYGSGRTSTSTTGRNSFSNLFNLGHRFRQESGAHTPRHGSPSTGAPGTPGLHSHTNSFNLSREALVIPKREEGETPGKYLERLEAVVPKGVIASIVSKSSDPFSLAVLRSYMRRFSFFGDPIDMAIRKLLMEVELPKETQQIDRVLQGFADRYHECNPGIFMSPDQAYFISFSIVILHTDFFNKNNKRKMQKQDYVKNSAQEGVSPDVLGCLYDNVIYTPFIHFEDEIDLKGAASRRTKKAILKAPMHAMNDPARKVTKEPIDPYTLIFENRLDILRPNIKEVMHVEDPYTYRGTYQTLDARALHAAFVKYGVLQIVSARSRPEAFMNAETIDNPNDAQAGVVEMPVTKIGILWRKDAKKKAARSPWQEWGAVLTRSGLSFFKNAGWAKSLMHQHDQYQSKGHGGIVVFKPPLQEFKPDHTISMDGTVALMDTSYKKHKNAFVIFSKGGMEETFLADNEGELNDWLGVVNYAAAFETQSVRPRGLIGGLYEGQRSRGLRRLESSHSTHSVPTATGDVTIMSGKIDQQLAQQISSARRELVEQKIREAEEKLTATLKQLDAQERDARHLQIMAPVHPKTREQVIHAAGRMEAKLKWMRIEYWRLKCHRDILLADLDEERRSSNETTARIEQVQPEQATPPTAHSARTSRISGLARLNSKASNIIASSQRSPSLSLRPNTKSSGGITDADNDVFKTPPEHSRQNSPGHAPSTWELPGLSFSPTSSPKLLPLDHKRPSVSTAPSVGASSISDADSRYTTPNDGIDAHAADASDGKPLGLHKPLEPTTSASASSALTDTGSLHPPRPTTPSEHSDGAPSALTSPESVLAGGTAADLTSSRGKVRRSLHRTLRESSAGGTPGHRRGGKGKGGSTSTVMSSVGGEPAAKEEADADADGVPEGEGLARSTGRFTLHGKKASVITFGEGWDGRTAEERLKGRRALSVRERGVGGAAGEEGEDPREEGFEGRGRRPVSAAAEAGGVGLGLVGLVGVEDGDGDGDGGETPRAVGRKMSVLSGARSVSVEGRAEAEGVLGGKGDGGAEAEAETEMERGQGEDGDKDEVEEEGFVEVKREDAMPPPPFPPLPPSVDGDGEGDSSTPEEGVKPTMVGEKGGKGEKGEVAGEGR